MPLTTENVIQAHESLVALIKTDKEEKTKISKDVRFKIAENFNATIPVITDYQAQHNALIAKNGKPDGKGQFALDPNSPEGKVFAIEKQDLLNQPSGIDKFHIFQYKDLPDDMSIDLIALLIKSGMIEN